MKTRRSFSSLAYSLTAVALCVASGTLRAGGSAGGVGGIGAGASAGGGGHAGVSSAGGAHASAPAASHGFSASRAGYGNLHPITATYAGPPHYLSGGFTPNTAFRSSGVSSGNNRPAAAAPFATQTSTTTARGSTPTVTTARNAWTDPASSQRTGQFLYPNASRDILGNTYSSGRGSGGSSRNGFTRYRFNRRGYNDPYIYGYPGIYGGYSPYLYGDGLGTADLNGDFTGGVPNTVADSDAVSPAAQSDLSRPYPSAQFAVSPDSADAAAPQVPAAANVQPANGPDSLVEAVQAELLRRGYFDGKVDAVYNEATHAAIQRFQRDQKLPASGRLNEATLHALELD